MSVLVRNKISGIETWYPENQAKWLVSIGKCEIVDTKKKTYQTKELKAEADADVAVQAKRKGSK